MRIGTRARAASAAAVMVVAGLSSVMVGAGSAQASAASCPAGGQVLGPIQNISVGSQTIGKFYLGWDCRGAYTEVNLWNTNYVNNWSYGQVTVKSSSNYSANNNRPIANAGTYWFDAGFIPVTGVSNTRLYKGNWNFTAYGHSCSGETPTWNFSNGSYSTADMFSHCS
ncbi:hypothetical protein [Kitasatospora purpeofusca]|uniref:hypothetical protein n=1 Tax=Kitasatospora purpeofusca TaxID=67352 RepID=UPI0004BE746C|nr:hypothetical protein [Kitasatospora purpeofusca]